MNLSSFRVCIGVVLFAAFAASWLVAAPVRPQKLKIPDEERCLAGIDSLTLTCEFYSPAIPAAGVEKEQVIEDMTKVLEGAGLAVRKDDITPRGTIQFFTATSDDTPDAIAITTILAVNQGVRIKRLDDDMVLPVSQIVTTAVCKRENLAVTIERETENAALLLTRYIKRATAEQNKP